MDSIILDVDGTLWDTTQVVAKAWNQATAPYRSEGVPEVMPDDLKQEFGKPMDVIFSDLFPMATKAVQDEMREACCIYETECVRKESGVLYPGVPETMRRLCKQIPLFIVSNCQKGYIELFLEKTGLSDAVTDHLCFGDTGKPKAETMRQLIEKNRLTAPIYVGDTEGDEKASQEAGVPFVFASYGFGTARSPRYTIRCFSELANLKE